MSTIRANISEAQLSATIADAWRMLWAANLVDRKNRDYRGRSYFLTATDLEHQVRCWLEDDLSGRPRTQKRAFGCYGFQVRFKGDLQALVRRWLFDQVTRGHLASHNFGRGHISGMRFRPAGDPIGPAEQATIEQRERSKDRPQRIHFSTNGWGGRPLCRRHIKKVGWGRPTTRSTHRWEAVNCPSCRKQRATLECVA